MTQELSRGDGMHTGHERRNQARLVAPFCQKLMDDPPNTGIYLHTLEQRAPLEAPQYSVPGQLQKTLLDPPTSVLVHMMTTRMLSDVTAIPVLPSPARRTNEPILATISPDILKWREDQIPQHHQGFTDALMESVNPYYEFVLEQVLDTSHPYAPVWQAYSQLTPQWVAALTDPDLIEYTTRQQHSKPINALHATLWEVATVLPLFAEGLAPLIDSDTSRSVGQFQRQAIEQGMVGLLAKSSEIPRGTRKKRVKNGILEADSYGQDSQTGMLIYGKDFTRAIAGEGSKCPGPYGLRDPDPTVREMCRKHNKRVGTVNRSSASFCPVDKLVDSLEVVSPAEVFAYYTLLIAPSTLWLPFLKSRGITDWSDVLPGTRVIRDAMIK